MNYEFVSKILINREKRFISRRSLLTLGIIIIIFSLSVEILIGNFFAVALIVPILYLMNLRNQMGSKMINKDIFVSIESNDNYLTIILFNSIISQKKLCTSKYKISSKDIWKVHYDDQNNMLLIDCDCVFDVLNGNTVVSSENLRDYLIKILISKQDLIAVERIIDQNYIQC